MFCINDHACLDNMLYCDHGYVSILVLLVLSAHMEAKLLFLILVLTHFCNFEKC